MRLLACLLAILPCWAQTEQCSVEGQVFSLATGEPVKKAQIMLRPMGSSSRQPYGALTDAGGRFLLADVPAGRYVLTAERAGFVQSEYGAGGVSRRGGTITLAPGQRLKDVVFRLTPHGVVTGRVLDEDGEPVAGVQVQAMRYGYIQGRRMLRPAASSTTNDIGEYRLAGLPPGRFYLSATYRAAAMFGGGGSADQYAPTYYPGTADPAAAAPVQVVQGNQLRGMDFALTRTRTVRVSGRVSNPDATGGSRNVMVFLMPRGGGMGGYSSRNSSVVQEGRFEIAGVTPGAYTIAAHWYEEGQRYTASQPIDVGNAGVDDVNLTLAPGFELSGRVRIEGAAEAPLGDARVSLRPANELALAPPMGGRVQPDGSFQLNAVAPDHYRVMVFGMPESCYLKSARLGDSEMLENGATVNAGAGRLEIVLSSAGGLVEGLALDEKQQPVPGAVVVLVPDERRRDRLELFKNVNADQHGRFTIQGIAPGDYRLFAWQDVDSGAWQDPEFLKPFERSAATVSLKENGRETVQLKVLASQER
ncbi:MAG TPA: carboxypeptidase regulatory-like domain-containing protein [Bryobacteraceae bacterium]|nr:carboxypeptidase regulatory-like domain-containing protein [Bryobacteraceae bacterium]